jgi:hypothetical protein
MVMKNKVWHKVIITTKEQNVSIYPDETFWLEPDTNVGVSENSGIIVETKELDGDPFTTRLYLNRDEMELLIIKMQEMMNYVDQK